MSAIDILLDDFINALYAERNISSHTAAAYRRDVSAFLNELARNHVAVSDYSAQQVEDWIAHKTNEGYAPASISRALSSIKQFSLFLLEEGLREDSPTEPIKLRHRHQSLPHTISKETIHQLIDHILHNDAPHAVRLYTILYVLYTTGLRISELLQLRYDDISITSHEENRIMCLRVKGKGSKERLVPLHTLTQGVLSRYLKLRDSFIIGSKMSPWLFPSYAKQGHITRQAVSKALKQQAIEAGLDPVGIHAHALRHSFASHMLAQGIDLRTIQTLLGHASITSTEIYTHVTSGHLQELVASKHPLA